MRITRLIAGAVSVGLLGLAPVALSAPAQATENLTTTVTLEFPFLEPGTAATYGDKLILRGAVTDSTGGSVYDGTVTLLEVTPSNPAGTPVATVDASGYLGFPEVKATGKTTYRAVYSGYAATSTYEDNLAASTSADLTLAVSRKLTIKNPRGTFIKGKIAPKYKKKKVLVQKKVGKKWKKFRTLKTNKKSAFTTTLPAYNKRTYWRFVVKGSKGLSTVTSEGSTIRYRSASGRVALR